MHFVNTDGAVDGVGLLAESRLRHFFRQAAYHRCGGWAQFGSEGVRVGLLAHIAVGIQQLEFIKCIERYFGDENFPNAGRGVEAHRIATAVPLVKFADNRYATGVWRPQAEVHAVDAVYFGRMRTHRFIRAQMAAFGQQPGIQILHAGSEAVRVFYADCFAAGMLHQQRIIGGGFGRQNRGEETAFIGFGHFNNRFAAGAVNHGDFFGIRLQGADHIAQTVHAVAAEVGEGVAVSGKEKAVDRLLFVAIQRRIGWRGGSVFFHLCFFPD